MVYPLELDGRDDHQRGAANVKRRPDSLLSQFGRTRQFARDEAIYAEGSHARYWYQVVYGSVRLVAQLSSELRHVERFCFADDCFGFDLPGRRSFSAEAVEDCVVRCCRRQSVGQLIKDTPEAAQQLWDASLRDLAQVQLRTVMLARMSAPMRVASFLIDLHARRGPAMLLDLPMPRADIADYLGLTVETVCRVLSRFVALKLVTIPNVNQIQLIDASGLATISSEGFDPALGPYYGTRRTRDRAKMA
jgi:CRP/FNR family nitrogen fixation transcriptional regulator